MDDNAIYVFNTSVNKHPFQDDVIIENYDPKIGFTVPSDSLNSAILNLVVCGFNLTYPKPTHKYKDVFIHKCRLFLVF